MWFVVICALADVCHNNCLCIQLQQSRTVYKYSQEVSDTADVKAIKFHFFVGLVVAVESLQ